MPQATFDSTKKPLKDLLGKVASGLIQLPDFQRGWVWDDDSIRSLLASISQSFPVGAIMTLETGGQVRFKPRLIEGASASPDTAPEGLLLDGQQRFTSLYQTAVRREVVATTNTKKQAIKRWYYIDMQMAVEPAADREEAIFGVPEDRVIRSDFGRKIDLDLSSPDREYAQLMFPMNRVFDDRDWQRAFEDYWRNRGDTTKRDLYWSFHDQVVRNFDHYHLPVIALGKETPKEAVCLVFEKVNTGGKKLDAFELLTAIFAASAGPDGFRLRRDWYGDPDDGYEGRHQRLAMHPTLTEVSNLDFLQAVTLFHTRDKHNADLTAGRTGKQVAAVSCTRAAILDLPLEAYKRYAPLVEEGFQRAAKFLRQQYIYRTRDVPYKTQLVPLAAILASIGEKWDDPGVRPAITRWFWSGVFGELYGSAVETRYARDFFEVPQWLEGGPEPGTVLSAVFQAHRLDTMRTRLSAAYKGLHALLMREGAQDFRSGQKYEQTIYFDENVDIHHIFPKDWCEKQKPKIPKSRYDAIVNKSPISARTNRKLGGDGPATYLARIERDGASPAELDRHLGSHAIDPILLRAQDFDGFYAARREALLQLIEKAMGKKAFRGDETNEPEGDPVEDEEMQPMAALA